MTDSPTPRHLITRRGVLKTLVGGVVASTGVVGWTLGIEPHWVQVVSRTLPLAGLPQALVGKRMVQLSDFHAGQTDADYLASICERVNTLAPDLIVLTGDYIDHESPESASSLSRILGTLRVPTLGAFACLGNHDYGRRWKQVDVADRIADQLHRVGIRLLRNESANVAGLTIVGLEDLWSPRYHPWDVMSAIDGSRDAICLCHNPDANDFPEHWFDFRGWTLAGHTHGGQCKPPFLPPPLLPVENRNYVAGAYDVAPGRRLYISRGVGHTLRARFNCRPEITLFTLVNA